MYISLSLDDARTTYCGYTQPNDMILTNYMRHFQSLIEVLERYNITIGKDRDFLDKAGIFMDGVEPDGI